MKIKCINKGNFKSLTLGWVYEVVAEEDGYYFIENDKGTEARYSVNYFEVYVEEPPKPVFDIKYSNYGGGIYLKYTEEKYYDLISNEVAGNCGTESINGLNNICNQLDDWGILTEENIKKVVDEIVSNSDKSVVVFSTNKDYPLLWDVLDANCDFNSDKVINTNSGNPIKIWGFYNVE